MIMKSISFSWSSNFPRTHDTRGCLRLSSLTVADLNQIILKDSFSAG